MTELLDGKKTINKELTGAQDLYNFLFEACNIIRGPVSQDNFKDYITPLLYYKRISDVYDEETEEALKRTCIPDRRRSTQCTGENSTRISS